MSPDGRRIVFAQSGRGLGEAPPLWIANVDGTGRRRVKMPPGVTGDGARWSPDGRQLAFVGVRTANHDHAGIRILDLATGRVRRLPGLGENEHSLAWSPDGRWLAMLRHLPYDCVEPDTDTCYDTQIWLVSTTDSRRKSIFRIESGWIESGLDWGPAVG